MVDNTGNSANFTDLMSQAVSAIGSYRSVVQDQLPAVVDMEEAIKEGSPLVHSPATRSTWTLRSRSALCAWLPFVDAARRCAWAVRGRLLTSDRSSRRSQMRVDSSWNCRRKHSPRHRSRWVAA